MSSAFLWNVREDGLANINTHTCHKNAALQLLLTVSHCPLQELTQYMELTVACAFHFRSTLLANVRNEAPQAPHRVRSWSLAITSFKTSETNQ
jgi:hypothetical protein